MTLYEFIFSEKKAQRIYRHVSFWLLFSLHIFFYRFYVYNLGFLSTSAPYITRFENLVFFLPISIFFAYFAIYFLLPKYILEKKYAGFIMITLAASALSLLVSYLISVIFNIKLAWDMPLQRGTIVQHIDFTFHNGIVYPLMVSGFATGLKMGKNFYQKEKETQLLTKQKIDAEVMLLKGYIHPRFLFNSLKTIHEDLLNGTKNSPDMLLKLSDLLSYILYESDDQLLPLDKELSMLEKYIGLEKNTWKGILELHVKNDCDENESFIAPLILLPVTESVLSLFNKNEHQQNSSKFYAMAEKRKFNFSIEINDCDHKYEELLNNNVQLQQVKKRLNALYPAHEFYIKTEKATTKISLSLLLEETEQ